LSRRLRVVREQLQRLLADRSGTTRIISMCAGDGRDVLPVLAGVSPATEALLVELDPELAARASRTALELGLERVVVRNDDAGSTDAYRGFVPADVVLACGVFGNVSDADVERTVRALRSLLHEGGHVIWTRGANVPDDPTQHAGDPAEQVRHLFARAGFEERAFVRPEDASFRVGVHRLTGSPDPYVPGVELFTFV
jgi:methylase of polypeptide subunit release factors